MTCVHKLHLPCVIKSHIPMCIWCLSGVETTNGVVGNIDDMSTCA